MDLHPEDWVILIENAGQGRRVVHLADPRARDRTACDRHFVKSVCWVGRAGVIECTECPTALGDDLMDTMLRIAHMAHEPHEYTPTSRWDWCLFCRNGQAWERHQGIPAGVDTVSDTG